MPDTSTDEVMHCGYCPEQVAYRATYIGGHALCFNARLSAASKDHHGDGWIPAPMPIAGTLRTVWAPRRVVPEKYRRSANLVATLHTCPGQSRRASA